MYFADWNNRCESLWMTIVAMLVSKGQFNISGRCCRKLLETLLSINKPPTRCSNRQVGFFRWCWSNGFQFERSFTGIRKMLERRTKTIVGDCSKPNSRYFDVESTNVFFYFFLHIVNTFFVFLPSNCHDLWLIMQAVLFSFKYFQRTDKNKLQQQDSFTQFFNGWIKSDSWFCLAGGCQKPLGPQTALYTVS